MSNTALRAKTVTAKLMSPKGTVLGIIGFPAHWAEQMERYQDTPGFNFVPPLDPRLFSYGAPSNLDNLTHGTLRRSHFEQGAFELYGMSLEQFEKIPGCSFSPGAAYLRSIVD